MLKVLHSKGFFHASVKEIPPQCSKFCHKKIQAVYEVLKMSWIEQQHTYQMYCFCTTIQQNPFNTILRLRVFVKNYFPFKHKRQVEMKRYRNHLSYIITKYGNHFVVFNSKLIVKLMSVTHFSVMVMLVLNFSFVDATNTKRFEKFQMMSCVDFVLR